ncbi:aldehyde dehydrogenase family protein [Duganella sp. FT3S]|uniref:Aldehyde dehydrogenase family protein n=2 Tax=Rugamonas fusca TaxID=2758568 RepID=A0A7W2EL89_9BURK|nr:aldehyde dehydrogenase family protein [Rugamonas fusca]
MMGGAMEAGARLQALLARLAARRQDWAALPVGERIALLRQVRERIPAAAERWIDLSNAAKGIDADSPLQGEEWTSGPWALLATCDHLLATLEQIADQGRPAVHALRQRSVAGRQLAVEVFPQTIFDRLLLSGVRAEVWMQPEVNAGNLASHVAAAYRDARHAQGELALILGAGNISSIAPLDALHKLYSEKAVCIVKLNPVNEYLLPVFEEIFAPLAERDFLHFVTGGGEVGALLCQHALVDTIHITGSQATHDAIVYGHGPEGEANRRANRPLNPKPISSELGAVCPTIVVPGPWTAADIAFQASHIATQKLHNSGFNCVASQVLVLPAQWRHTPALRAAVREQLAAAPDRKPYYPGAASRQAQFAACQPGARRVNPIGAAANREVVELPPASDEQVFGRCTEVFAPTLCEQLLDGADAESYLRHAIAYANDKLRGTLGANILIHPATIKALGPRFDELLLELHYGCIAINAWTGLGYLLTQAPWGAFPGHVLNDVQSGIGSVHNTHMFDKAQRTVVRAPFRPFPRSVLGGALTLLPNPPWFVNNRQAHNVARKLFAFQVRPSWFKLPGIFFDALRG